MTPRAATTNKQRLVDLCVVENAGTEGAAQGVDLLLIECCSSSEHGLDREGQMAAVTG